MSIDGALVVTCLEVDPDEWWWGGAVADGQSMPFGARPHARDLGVNAGRLDDPTAGANQSASLLLSSQGRVVWSPDPFSYGFRAGTTGMELVVTGSDVVVVAATEPTLRGAFREASRRFFPASGTAPARPMFTAPQYNTWIEMPFTPSQDGVIAYAERILAAGLPPGVIMIDDCWAPDYGDWQFDTRRFPDPRAMVEVLKGMGFGVMLWVVPYVSPDSAVSRHLERQRLLVRDTRGEVVLRRWWNGWSTVLDLTSSAARAWWRDRLRDLQDRTGVDGFKFDGGDLRDYREGDARRGRSARVDQTQAYGRFGAEFAFNEFRAAWNAGGLPLAQRLHDKPPTWGPDGLGSLVPEGIAQSLTGHAFICADMVGGGDLASFRPGAEVDSEQFVRYAQCAMLFPMVQFSIDPARVLPDHALDAVRSVLALRQELLPEILALVEHAARTGEPILRPLAYEFPGVGLETVTDQYLVGRDILVAPVLEQGATSRTIVVPPGRWARIGPGLPSGLVLDGGPRGATHSVPVTLETFPVFRRTC